jgi:hypothetical protein
LQEAERKLLAFFQPTGSGNGNEEPQQERVKGTLRRAGEADAPLTLVLNTSKITLAGAWKE